MFLFDWIQKFKVINRFNYILISFFRVGFNAFIYQNGLAKYIPFSHQLDIANKTEISPLPENLKKTLERLGPVFVKFGQILSTRSDILPKEYLKELEKLQSTVEPFPFFEAKKVIEKNLKKPFSKIFKKFEQEPFASASLGQVYKAELFSGEKVAVKVQRPKAKELIKLDTQVLLMLAHFAEKHIEKAKDFRPIEMVQEFRRWTINELDYHKEAINGEIFNNFFKDDPQVYSPKVFWEYTGDSVLTLELVEGDALSDILKNIHHGKINKKLIVERMADSFIRQYFEFGYFHADPHPGNIFVIPGNKLMFLDFGMIGFMDAELTGLASGMFLALLQKDVEKILTMILKVEELYDERAQKQDIRDIVNINSLRKDLTQLVMQWSSTGKAQNFTQLINELIRAAIHNGVAVPVDLVMFSKSILTLDMVIHDLDPKFHLEKWEQPMVEKIIMERFKAEKIKNQAENIASALDSLVKRLPESTANIITNLERGRFGMELNAQQLVEYEKLLNVNSRFNTYGTLIAGIIIALALIYQSGTYPIVWKFTMPGWGVYLGIFLLFVWFIKTRSYK